MATFVLDASAAVDMLLRLRAGDRIAQCVLATDSVAAAPELLDIEVVQALRRAQARGIASDERIALAYTDLKALSVSRWSHGPLRDRVFALRDALSAYDATYVALAESLAARLLTSDARLARGAAHLVDVEVFTS